MWLIEWWCQKMRGVRYLMPDWTLIIKDTNYPFQKYQMHFSVIFKQLGTAECRVIRYIIPKWTLFKDKNFFSAHHFKIHMTEPWMRCINKMYALNTTHGFSSVNTWSLRKDSIQLTVFNAIFMHYSILNHINFEMRGWQKGFYL